MQQDSKLVQVDLQDLGYETSGRSENEAEREEASSPGDTPQPDNTLHSPTLTQLTQNSFMMHVI